MNLGGGGGGRNKAEIFAGKFRSENSQRNLPVIFLEFGEHPGDHNHQDLPKSIAVQVGGVLRYKWEAYCDTNGRSAEVFPFPESSVAPEALHHKLEAYCSTNWRCIARFL